ncbi:MAG: hypothetical protein QCI38_00425 [Candidatus Thermoplasmatota archaeon]|nr:hypothetical protein [Candidatus Thermoplasmatota archaeon]
MKVELLAADSLGARSMAVHVETKDIKLTIDPGVALGPRRFGLPPTKEEEKALEEASIIIASKTAEADALVISHYHYDHHTPSKKALAGKKLFLKDPVKSINKSQKERAAHMLSLVDDAEEICFADGKSFEEGNTAISFSPPVPHGPPGTSLGYVIMTSIHDGSKTMVHTSDVEGILDAQELSWIIEQEPDMVIADGPPTYLLGYRFGARWLEESIRNIRQLLESTDCKLVLDHHLLRDKKYAERMCGLFEDPRVYTFASFDRKPEQLLEATRKELHKKEEEQ